MSLAEAGGLAVPSGRVALRVVPGGTDAPLPTDAELLEAAERRGLVVPVDELLSAQPPTVGRMRQLAERLGMGWLRQGLPDLHSPVAVADWREDNIENLWRGARQVLLAKVLGLPTLYGALRLVKLDGLTSERLDLGLASLRVVTDVGCQKIVAIMNTSDAATAAAFKFHGIGTGTTVEASTDTALVTELTTEYNPDNTRATGTQTTGATTKVYRTVATNTLDSGTPAVTEHAPFSQAATGGGSMLDRSKFSAINLTGANGDGLTSQYDLTFTSGG